MIEFLMLVGLSAKQCVLPESIVLKTNKSVVQIIVSDKEGRMGSGSGLVVNNNGDIITSTHVIDTAANIIVLDSTGEQYSYQVKKIGSSDSVSSIMPSTLKKPANHNFSYADR